MNERNYDRKTLDEYLLGALPEAETEYYDELSVTDNHFNDALRAAENDLVDAYARGTLTGAKLERFESYYLASPHRREKVRFAAVFQDYAESRSASFKQESLPGFFSGVKIFLSRNRLRFAVAAVLLILIFGGLRFFLFRSAAPQKETASQNMPAPSNSAAPETINSNQTNTEIADVPNPTQSLEVINKNASPAPNRNAPVVKTPDAPQTAVVSFVLAPPLRSNQLKTLIVPETTERAAFRLELETDDYPSYRVSLENQSGRNLWQSGKLKAQKSGAARALSLNFRAVLLKPGIYSFTVTGIKPDGAAEIITNYSFRAARQ